MTHSFTLDPQKLREDFPILHQEVNGHPLVYFDNGATTQKPTKVIDAIRHYYEKDNSNVHRGMHALSNRSTKNFEATRERIAQFIGAAKPQEIIYTRGTTEAINLVANTWGNANIKAGDEILLTEMEHHANIVPWQLLCQRSGAKLKYVPFDLAEGRLDEAAVEGLLTPRVKLFAFTHISNTMGVINPVEKWCAIAKSKGITTLVDAAQSAGHGILNVQAIGCDFLVFSGHKMCGPTGIGCLYGRLEFLNAMPPWQGGGEMIVSVRWEDSTWKPSPDRFEAGTPHIEGPVGLHAAIDYLESIGRENIAAYDHAIAAYAVKILNEIPGLGILGPKGDRAGLITFVLDDIHAHDLVTFVDQRGVALRGGHHCNQPLLRKIGVPSAARASFYFYNTFAEVDRLAAVLREAREFFSRGT